MTVIEEGLTQSLPSGNHLPHSHQASRLKWELGEGVLKMCCCGEKLPHMLGALSQTGVRSFATALLPFASCSNIGICRHCLLHPANLGGGDPLWGRQPEMEQDGDEPPPDEFSADTGRGPRNAGPNVSRLRNTVALHQTNERFPGWTLQRLRTDRTQPLHRPCRPLPRTC